MTFNLKRFLIFISGFLASVLATIFVSYILMIAKKPIDDGLIGLTVFPKNRDCVKTASKSKSTEIDRFQVVKSNMALVNIKSFIEQKVLGRKLP